MTVKDKQDFSDKEQDRYREPDPVEKTLKTLHLHRHEVNTSTRPIIKVRGDQFALISYNVLVACVLEDGSSFSVQNNVNHAVETNLSYKEVFVQLLPVRREITRALCDTAQTRRRHHGKAQ